MQIVRRFEHDAPVAALTVSPDSSLLYVASANKVHVWNVATGTVWICFRVAAVVSHRGRASRGNGNWSTMRP